MKKTQLTFIFLLLFFITYAQDSRELTIEELLINSTVRIESRDANNIYSGTGFIFGFEINDKFIDVIVTNRHVAEKGEKIKLRFTEASQTTKPIYGQWIESEFPNKSAWIVHPTEDLAIFPLGPIVETIEDDLNKKIFYSKYTETEIPSASVLDELSAIEEVLMIGYPKGLWDDVNNLPIVRKGLTATPIFIDYLGKKHFLVDIPVYHGSSGSPIISLNKGIRYTNHGLSLDDERIFLLGITFESYLYHEPIQIESTKDTAQHIQSNVKLPLNLARVVKSEEVLKFKPILEEFFPE